jgi:hypothetical protein
MKAPMAAEDISTSRKPAAGGQMPDEDPRCNTKGCRRFTHDGTANTQCCMQCVEGKDTHSNTCNEINKIRLAGIAPAAQPVQPVGQRIVISDEDEAGAPMPRAPRK